MTTTVLAAGDSTSNWDSATNSHTRWVGLGTYCSFYGETNPKATSNVEYSIEIKGEGQVHYDRIQPGDEFSDDKVVPNLSNWRGIVNWGKITIIV